MKLGGAGLLGFAGGLGVAADPPEDLAEDLSRRRVANVEGRGFKGQLTSGGTT